MSWATVGLSHKYVVAMGLERIDSDGNIEGVPWVWSPPEQPGWQTLGLLERACTETHYLEFEDED